ncbi:MAG: tRNA1(Val) (adenine(37)-N6)-methyltransferase [Clostridia bacterium]|nr:tRNA1(Val) (adenine(37)-N6)-methyltransferase [Clostridia bacterium]
MELHDREEIVDLQYKELKLIQNDKVFKFGTDAVLLSSFVTVKKGETLVDLGTGSGIIPILLSGRTEASFYGVEIQDDAYELAVRNVELNHKDNIKIIHDDLANIRKHIEQADVVTVNPPYDKLGSGEMQKEDHMQIAFYEVKTDLETIVHSASSILPTGGRFYMIHRSYRMAEIIETLRKNRLEPKEIRPIAKKYDAEPRYILIKALKDAREGMRLLPSLILYKEDGTYTDEMRKIYHMEEE